MDDMISRRAVLDKFEPWLKVKDYNDGELNMLKAILYEIRFMRSAQPEPCEDAVPRASVEYICRKNTVSTNPYEHEHHEKFIKFMDDPEIADFGRWQHSNGFNTALVAVKCDLDKVPSVTPKQRIGKWIKTARWGRVYYCDQCRNYLDFDGVNAGRGSTNFCPNCGAKMEVTT